MNRSGMMAGLAPVSVGLMLLGGCTTMESDGYWVSDNRGDSWYSHDHAYGYRNPHGLIVEYDPGLMLYAVVSSPNVYWNDPYYYRRHGHHWERSRHHHGPWVVYHRDPPRVAERPARRIRPPTPLRPDTAERRFVQRPVFPAPRREPIRRPPKETRAHREVRRLQEGGRGSERRFEPVQRRNERNQVPKERPWPKEPYRAGQQSRGGGTAETGNRFRRGDTNPQPERRGRSRPPAVDRTPDKLPPLLTERHHERIEWARKYGQVRSGSARRPGASGEEGGAPTRRRTPAPRANAGPNRQDAARIAETRGGGTSRRRVPGRQGEPQSDDQRLNYGPRWDGKQRLSPARTVWPAGARERL
jgi:hypothetical protein